MTPRALVVTGARFFSRNDERAFFEWLERIDGFVSVKGAGRDLHLQIDAQIADAGLRDLIAPFSRYRLDLEQLAEIVPRPWLDTATAYSFERDRSGGHDP